MLKRGISPFFWGLKGEIFPLFFVIKFGLICYWRGLTIMKMLIQIF